MSTRNLVVHLLKQILRGGAPHTGKERKGRTLGAALLRAPANSDWRRARLKKVVQFVQDAS